MSEDQKKMIEKAGFGGLLKIACDTIPADFANWLVDCFDAESSQLVFPGRGRISVTVEAVFNVLGLPNKGDMVKYELDVDAINFIIEEYGMEKGTTPSISTIVERVKNNKNADADYLRSWLTIDISTFLCPPTSLGISPRCYPSILDLSAVKKLNWCQFVVDQLKEAASKMAQRNSVKGCLLLLLILYVDSVMVKHLQIPSDKPRIAVWSRKLLDEVIKQDTNHDGSFGKLRLKGSANSTVQTPLFFQMDDIRRFVSSKVSAGTSAQKKRKLSDAVTTLCTGLTELVGTFLQQISDAEPSQTRAKRIRVIEYDEEQTLEEEETDTDPEYEEQELPEEDSTDEDSEKSDPDEETGNAEEDIDVLDNEVLPPADDETAADGDVNHSTDGLKMGIRPVALHKMHVLAITHHVLHTTKGLIKMMSH